MNAAVAARILPILILVAVIAWIGGSAVAAEHGRRIRSFEQTLEELRSDIEKAQEAVARDDIRKEIEQLKAAVEALQSREAAP